MDFYATFRLDFIAKFFFQFNFVKKKKRIKVIEL